LFAHVPGHHEVLRRECGAYSVRRRARWRRANILTDSHPLVEISPAAGDHTSDWATLRAMRQRWATLLHPRSGLPALSEMRALACILDPNAIAAILRHLRRKGRDP